MKAFISSTPLSLAERRSRQVTPMFVLFIPHARSSYQRRLRIRVPSMSVSEQASTATWIRIPQIRISSFPLSVSERLKRLSNAVALMYLPAILLLVARTGLLLKFAPLPLSERCLSLALAIICPEFRNSARENLLACSYVARRAEQSQHNSERLVRPVKIHTVLTAVTTAGTLGGLFTALFRPSNGALVTLLFQVIFWLVRQVRFEPMGRVYRCNTNHYRDIVFACVVAALFAYAVLSGFFPLLFAGAALTLSLLYWVFKWIFVPPFQ